MRSVALFVGVVLVSAGCGKSKPAETDTPVTGKVTLDGKQLTMGEVFFEAEDGSASGGGEIGSDGTYRVASAPLGKVKAAVRTARFAQFAGTKSKGGKSVTMGGRDGTYVPVPERYEDTTRSKLSYTITKDAVIDIALTK